MAGYPGFANGGELGGDEGFGFGRLTSYVWEGASWLFPFRHSPLDPDFESGVLAHFPLAPAEEECARFPAPDASLWVQRRTWVDLLFFLKIIPLRLDIEVWLG